MVWTFSRLLVPVNHDDIRLIGLLDHTEKVVPHEPWVFELTDFLLQ